MSSHTIRLHGGPWLIATESSAGGTVKHGPLEEAFGSVTKHDNIVAIRRFNRPTGLSPATAVFLAIEAEIPPTAVFLNESRLHSLPDAAPSVCIDITRQLCPHNEIRLEWSHCGRLDLDLLTPPQAVELRIID